MRIPEPHGSGVSLAPPVPVLVLSLLLLLPVLNLGGVQGVETSPQKGMLWSLPNPIAGDLTTEVTALDLDSDGLTDLLAIPAQDKLLLLDAGTGATVKEINIAGAITAFTQVNDVDGDGLQELGVSIFDYDDPEHPSSIQLFVSKDWSSKWSYAPKTKVFTESGDWGWRGMRTWDLGTLGSTPELILATSWKYLIALEASTGHPSFTYAASDDLWQLEPVGDLTGDGTPDIALGGQEGVLYLVSGADGKEISSLRLTTSYEGDENDGFTETITRSLWDLVYLPSNGGQGERLAVSAEDGALYMLNLMERELLWKEQLVLSQKPDYQTHFYDDAWFNHRVWQLGPNRLLSMVRMGQDDSGSKLILVDPSASTDHIVFEVSENSTLSLGDARSLVPFGNTTPKQVLIPVNLDGGRSHLGVMQGTTGEWARFIANELFGEPDRLLVFHPQAGVQALLQVHDNSLIVTDFTTGEIIWDLLGRLEVDLEEVPDRNGDGLNELLLLYKLGELVREAKVVDRASGELLWHISTPLKEVEQRGHSMVRVTPDLTGDGLADLVALRGDGEVATTRLVLYDLNSTTPLWEAPVSDFETFSPGDPDRKVEARLTGLELGPDMNGDGKADLVGSGPEGSVFIWSTDGKLIDHFSSSFPWSWEGEFLVRFDGNQSMNSTGQQAGLWYLWESDLQGKLYEGPLGGFQNELTEGVHTITLTVHDNATGKEDVITTTTRVRWPDQPEARWRVDPWAPDDKFGRLELTTRMDYTFSQEYNWDSWGVNWTLEGPGGYFQSRMGDDQTFNLTQPGVYHLNETVTDRVGRTDEATRVLVVRDSGQPKAEISVDGYGSSIMAGGRVNEPVRFYDNSRTDFNQPEDNDWITNHTWRWGDNVSYEMNPAINFDTPGRYWVTLEVADNYSRTDSDRVELIIREIDQPTSQISEPNLWNNYRARWGHHLEGFPWNIRMLGYQNDSLLFVGDGQIMAMDQDLDEVWAYRPMEGADDQTLVHEHDLSGDGIKDLVWREWRNERPPLLVVIDGSNGQELASFELGDGGDEKSFYYLLEHLDDHTADLNGDGTLDLVQFSSNQWPPFVQAQSGKDGSQIWLNNEIIKEGNWDINSPVLVVDDATGDGRSDVLLATSRQGELGAEIRLLDGSTGKEVRSSVYELQQEYYDWIFVVVSKGIESLGDLTGDGKDEYMVWRDSEMGDVVQIIDFENQAILRTYEAGMEIISGPDVNGDGLPELLFVAPEGVAILDSRLTLRILTTGGEIEGDEIELTWEQPSEGPVEILVDGNSHGWFEGNSAKLKLAAGSHRIRVQAVDPFGGRVSDEITVKVPENPYIMPFNYAMLTLVALLALMKGVMPAVKRRRRTAALEAQKTKGGGLSSKKEEYGGAHDDTIPSSVPSETDKQSWQPGKRIEGKPESSPVPPEDEGFKPPIQEDKPGAQAPENSLLDDLLPPKGGDDDDR